MKRVKIYPGDVFRFGSAPLEQGYGQVLKSDILQYIIIFDQIFNHASKLHEVTSSSLLLSGWTSDARFISGDWKTVGSTRTPRDFIFPEYKVESAGRIWVTDNDGKHLRLADEQEASQLYFRGSHSPIGFEKAFWAHHGRGSWDDRFNRMLIASRSCEPSASAS